MGERGEFERTLRCKWSWLLVLMGWGDNGERGQISSWMLFPWNRSDFL